jgi:hypothetical protein
MTYFIVISILFTLYCLWNYHRQLTVLVPSGSVAWDGSMMYPPGQHQIPLTYEIHSLAPRITYFGQDESGKVQVIVPPQNSFEHVPTFRKRIALEWKPDENRILVFLKSGDVVDQIAKLLSVNLKTDLTKYAEKFGIVVVNTEGFGKKPGNAESDSVELGDGVEIEY